MARLGSFERLTAVVTGASSGIGRELALELGRRGSRVALLARREEALRAVADEIASLGGRALAIPCDVGEREQVFSAFRQVDGELGPVDLLVNNAGYAVPGHFKDHSWLEHAAFI